MTIDRTTLLREPGIVIWDTAKFWSQGDIVVTPQITRSAQRTSVHGTVDQSRATDRVFRISFTPAGEWEHLDKLFSPLALAFGASLMGATDKPLVIHTRSGKKLTFGSVALMRMPTITAGTTTTIFGPVEFMATVGLSDSPAAEASYYAFASEAYPGDTDFDPTLMYTSALSAAWGESTPWDEFFARSGWVIDPQMTTEAEVIDGIGTVDYKITDVMVTARCSPAGVTPAQVMAKLGNATAMGASRTDSEDLVLTADGIEITLTDAMLDETSAINYGPSAQIGDLTWRARRTWATGAMVPLLAVGTGA